MKLKTLKDIEIKYDRQIKPWDLINKTTIQLRQEAINHIKEMQKGFDSGGKLCIESNAKIEWIKHFFNISEEELR